MEAPNTQNENKVSENITDFNNANAILEVIGSSTVVPPRTMESTITSNSTNYKTGVMSMEDSSQWSQRNSKSESIQEKTYLRKSNSSLPIKS